MGRVLSRKKRRRRERESKIIEKQQALLRDHDALLTIKSHADLFSTLKLDIAASRPRNQFLFQLSKEREWIQDEFDYSGKLDIDVDEVAYESVKAQRVEDKIWNPNGNDKGSESAAGSPAGGKAKAGRYDVSVLSREDGKSYPSADESRAGCWAKGGTMKSLPTTGRATLQNDTTDTS
ncbi:hypothetical protein P152DRAFT_453020 [Eremomyces bilateralis CBS 781.70]|uniref:Uncharacterized protein n=1 Tax=Eremomyces bilateralis CBS 781.70 TaxID=1392243 RepID=A0A6G1FR98_9PEZI|nr:uncharacterized protein P152DRAFT_453020 [Eremomyces bilateralis CBS 781.70]KAF1808240.1 hypothetical protein P152DRAFT_453020 [Eremomyces bilateralis CBS 781.70]